MHKLLAENNGGTTIAEAYLEWKNLVDKFGSLMDKDVLNRMLRGKEMEKKLERAVQR